MAAQAPPARAPRAIVASELPLAEAVHRTLATGVAGMTYYETAAIAGEMEPLHQMRVAARRLRATVQLFAGAIHGSRMRIYKRDLPWLGQTAGAVRECDVMEALIRECGGRLDPALAGALTPLCNALAAERTAAHAKFVAELRAIRYTRMCERLDKPLLRRALPTTAAGCNAPAMIAPIARSVRKAGKRIGRDAPPEAFHLLRKRIKRFRYALEMLAEMEGKRARRALLRLEEMQELLGVHQDMVSTVAWLRAYAANAGAVPPETLMAVGAMLQALVMRREKLGVLDDALQEILRTAEQHLEAARGAAEESDRQAAIEAARQGAAEAARAATIEAADSSPSAVPIDDGSLSPEPPLAQSPGPGEASQPPSGEHLPVASASSKPFAPVPIAAAATLEPHTPATPEVAAPATPEPVTPAPDAAPEPAGGVPPTTPIPTNG